MYKKLLIIILSFTSSVAAMAGVLEDKVMYEQTIERKVNKVIDKILSEDTERIVHAEVLLKQETAQKTKISYIQTLPQEDKAKAIGVLKENELEMPGIARKELLGPAEKIITEQEIIKESPI
ncbi:MAG: hypothetical protein QME68_07985 [Elusimicrobiota bacterium]|nr:hypothetical protein [Elusimicrobiota bacterium]